jgi:SH3-like domain-containing protein
MTFLKFLSFIIIFIITSNVSLGLKKNKYLSTKYNEVNLRNGPGLNQLVLFKILAKGYPLEIKEEYENWYKVSDYKKRVGWVSKTQLSNTRYGILIKNNQKLYKFPNLNSKQLALVKSDYILRILKCRKSWCQVEDEKLTGWMLKKSLWGFISD